MIDHTSFAVKNYPKSLNFYDKTLKELGSDRIMTIDQGPIQTAGYYGALLILMAGVLKRVCIIIKDKNLLFFVRLLVITIFFSVTPKASGRTFIAIEGVTGAGKTTLATLLDRELDAEIIAEPIEKWCAVGDKGNLLTMYLQDRSKWGYLFLTYAFDTFIEAYLKAKTDGNILVADRSVYSCIYCFGRLMHNEQVITDMEWQVFKEKAFLMNELAPCMPDGIIYLRTTPNVCLQRVHQRNRTEEAHVAIEYLETLHQLHEAWLIDKQDIDQQFASIPVLILDGMANFKEDRIVQQKIITQIKQFIAQLNATV